MNKVGFIYKEIDRKGAHVNAGGGSAIHLIQYLPYFKLYISFKKKIKLIS